MPPPSVAEPPPSAPPLPDAPLLRELRDRPVAGQRGITISGSGPSVVVWADKEKVELAVAGLEERALGAAVLPLAIASRGTHTMPLEVAENAAPARLGAAQ